MLKTTLSKTELNSFGKNRARSERDRTGLARRGASEKLRKSLEEADTIESGEQEQARATIREVPDKNIRKGRMH